MTTLRVALSRYAHTVPLIDGLVKPATVDLEFVDISGATNPAFRKMARTQEFDVSELGISTAYSAKERGAPFTALPVFVTRRFDHEAIYLNTDFGITDPKQLEGKKVALRSYTVTDVIWSRGILRDLYGLDSDAVTWVVTGDEHIEYPSYPANCEFRKGENVEALLEAGEVAAIVNPYKGSAANIAHVIPNFPETEREWIARMGAGTMHHTVVVKDSLLAERPELAGDLLDAFERAKQPMLERIARGETPIEDPAVGFQGLGVNATSELVHPDPMPYGLERNRNVLEVFSDYIADQHLTSRRLSLEEVFVPVNVTR